MKTTFKVAATCTLLVNLILSSAAMAAPVSTDGLKEVQTSGTEKARVGEWKGDDTIIVDSQGNVTTSGELKKTSSFRPMADTNVIQKALPFPEVVVPTFEPPNESFATLASA